MEEKTPDPEIPEGGERLWDSFWQLSAERQHGQNGPLPLTSVQITSWCDLMGEYFHPEEVTILRKMDGAYLSAAGEEISNNLSRYRAEQSSGGKPNG